MILIETNLDNAMCDWRKTTEKVKRRKPCGKARSMRSLGELARFVVDDKTTSATEKQASDSLHLASIVCFGLGRKLLHTAASTNKRDFIIIIFI